MTRVVEDVNLLLRCVAEKADCSIEEIEWYSWPQVFGTTAGLKGGIGGAAMTNFQAYGFLTGTKGVKYCAGVWKDWKYPYAQEW